MFLLSIFHQYVNCISALLILVSLHMDTLYYFKLENHQPTNERLSRPKKTKNKGTQYFSLANSIVRDLVSDRTQQNSIIPFHALTFWNQQLVVWLKQLKSARLERERKKYIEWFCFSTFSKKSSQITKNKPFFRVDDNFAGVHFNLYVFLLKQA